MKTSELLREIANHRLAANAQQWETIEDMSLRVSATISIYHPASVLIFHLDAWANTAKLMEEQQAIRFMGLHFLAHMYEDEGD